MKKEFATKKSLIEDQIRKEKAIIESFAKTFNKIKRIDEVEIQPIDEPQGEEKPQVLDVDATLRAIQTALKSGAKVEVAIETGENENEFMEVFKMPMINLVTFVKGGKTVIPKNPEFLENSEEILIDGTPLKDSNFLRYKDAPAPKTPETPVFSDPNLSTIMIGDYKFERTGKFENISEEKILDSGWPSGGERPTENNLKPGLVFILTIVGGGDYSRTAFVREDLSIPYVVIEEAKDSKWDVYEKEFDGVTYGVLKNKQTNREFLYKTKELAQSRAEKLKEWKCEELKRTKI